MKVRIRREVVDEMLRRRCQSQGDLADQIGTSRSHLVNLLVGRFEPRPATCRRLMTALNVTDFDTLFVIEHPTADAGGHAEKAEALA